MLRCREDCVDRERTTWNIGKCTEAKRVTMVLLKERPEIEMRLKGETPN